MRRKSAGVLIAILLTHTWVVGCVGTSTHGASALPTVRVTFGRSEPVSVQSRWAEAGFVGGKSRHATVGETRSLDVRPLSLTFINAAPDHWTDSRLRFLLGRTGYLFGQCEIALGTVRILRFDSARLAKNGVLDANEWLRDGTLAKLWQLELTKPHAPIVVLGNRFIESTPDHYIAGQNLKHARGSVVLLRGEPGLRQAEAVTLAHELGHELGLVHADEADDDNVMAPRACNECGFAPAQCDVLRKRPLAQGLWRP